MDLKQHVDSKRAQREGYISIHVATLDLPKDPTVGWLNGGGGSLIWHRSDPRGFQNVDENLKTPPFRMKLEARFGERLNSLGFRKLRSDSSRKGMFRVHEGPN